MTSNSSSRGNSSSSSILPQLVSPASLLQLQLSLVPSSSSVNSSNGTNTAVVAGTPQPVLICPSTPAAAFCSFSPDALTVGSFGTLAGVNSVLQGLSVSMPPPSSSLSPGSPGTTVLRLTLSDSVNPTPLVMNISLAALPIYKPVNQIKPLNLSAKVGKYFSEPIADYFSFDANAVGIAYVLISNVSWLTIQGGFIGGTPPSPPAVVGLTVVASDKYTRNQAQGTVNISWPQSPVAYPPALSHWYVASSTQLDVQLQQDGLVVDPEGGTISYALQRYAGSPDLQPLPQFLTFDANNLRMSGTPQASDVGMYPLILIGTSQWGTWKGNATLLLTITVSQSWGDFFAWVYSIVGSLASALGVVTWCLVYRALITNILMFKHRMRPSPPDELCTKGRYTLRCVTSSPPLSKDGGGRGVGEGAPIPANGVKSVSVSFIDKPPRELRFYEVAYLFMHSRLSDTSLKTDLITGVPWAQIAPTRENTVELIMDIPALQVLVATGKVKRDDEYYVEVISSGRWSSGTVIEAFTFHVFALLRGSAASSSFLLSDEPATSGKVAQQLKSVKARLLGAEERALSAENRLQDAEAKANRTAIELSVLREEMRRALQLQHGGSILPREKTARVDPYTGQPILILQGANSTDRSADDDDDDEEDESSSSDDCDASAPPTTEDSESDEAPPPPPPLYAAHMHL